MTGEAIPQRPYLYRALHEWMTDSGHTPHIVVDANHPGAVIPAEFVEDGRIVLNISYSATHSLVLGNESIEFQARFGGRSFDVSVPESAVLAIYARETGEGMVFGEPAPPGEEAGENPESVSIDEPPNEEPRDEASTPRSQGRSHLKVVK